MHAKFKRNIDISKSNVPKTKTDHEFVCRLLPANFEILNNEMGS